MGEIRCIYCGKEWDSEYDYACDCGVDLYIEDDTKIEVRVDNCILEDGYVWSEKYVFNEDIEYDYIGINSVDDVLEDKRHSRVIIK